MSKDVVTLGVQCGDETAGSVMEPHFMPLRLLLRDVCKGPYSKDISTFDFVLRIDGDMWYWKKSGFDNVFVRPKQSCATADIFVPREIWEPRDAKKIREYLATHLRGALEVILTRMLRSKISVERERLLSDINVALHDFTSPSTPTHGSTLL
jgi:hypothetical protein